MEEKKEEKKINIEELEKKCQEYLNGWKRERADFMNYKKEEMERISGLIYYSREEIIIKFLPVLDNLYLAEKQIPEEYKNDKWVEGLIQIKTQMLDFLKSQDVEEIAVKDDNFDPNIQEAIETEEKEGIDPGKVLEEIKKGYMMNNKVLRPAQVKVSK